MAKHTPIYDYSLLRGKIKTVFGSEKKFAEAIGIDANTLSYKLNPKPDRVYLFTQGEIDKACFLLGIKPTEIYAYFFTK